MTPDSLACVGKLKKFLVSTSLFIGRVARIRRKCPIRFPMTTYLQNPRQSGEERPTFRSQGKRKSNAFWTCWVDRLRAVFRLKVRKSRIRFCVRHLMPVMATWEYRLVDPPAHGGEDRLVVARPEEPELVGRGRAAVGPRAMATRSCATWSATTSTRHTRTS